MGSHTVALSMSYCLQCKQYGIPYCGTARVIFFQCKQYAIPYCGTEHVMLFTMKTIWDPILWHWTCHVVYIVNNMGSHTVALHVSHCFQCKQHEFPYCGTEHVILFTMKTIWDPLLWHWTCHVVYNVNNMNYPTVALNISYCLQWKQYGIPYCGTEHVMLFTM